jgi:hypothetical protein
MEETNMMAKLRALLFVVMLAPAAGLGKEKGKPPEYVEGTFAGKDAVKDGTWEDTVHCGGSYGTTCSGGVYDNYVLEYRVRLVRATLVLEMLRDADDTASRELGAPVFHFRAAKDPLSGLREGDTVRLRDIKGTHFGRPEVALPLGDGKEAKYVVVRVEQDAEQRRLAEQLKQTCVSGRLSPELQAKYCAK